MGLKQFRLTTAALTVICFLLPLCAGAEVKAVSTEKNGKVQQIVWTDEATGEPAAGPDGYAIVKYSTKKDAAVEMYFDAAGEPYETEGGYYGRAVTTDAKKRVVQIEYLGKDGARTLNNRGYAMVAFAYYGFGEIRTVTYYGLNKKPVTVPSLGYASVATEYSSRTMTSRTFKNAKGKPVDSVDGYAVIKQKVNKNYQVIRIRYEHADGSPATGPDGWFRCVKERDDQGRITSIKYYDEQEELTDRGAGYAWEEREYSGDSVLVTRYDLSGQKVSDSAGVATLVQEMKDDRVVRERFLDAAGEATVNNLGVAAVQYGYDHLGRIETVSYLGADGQPAKCSKGYAGYRDQRDDDGATTVRTFLGTDGMPTEIPGGYSEIRYFYDESKQLAATRYYNLNGSQVQTN